MARDSFFILLKGADGVGAHESDGGGMLCRVDGVGEASEGVILF